MLRVLHLYSGNLYGGVERSLVTLAQHAKHCPDLELSFALCFEGRLADELREAGAQLHMLAPARVSRPWTVWRVRRLLAALLRRRPFDVAVCHACWPYVVFAPIVRRHRLPLVFWARDVPTGRHWLERWAGRTAPDLVLANSRFTLSAMPRLFPGVHAEVCYPPVAAPPADDRAGVARAKRAALDTPEDAVVILLASRLERWKGHALLVSALARLRDLASWRCWIAGGAQRPHEAAYLAELQQVVARNGLAARIRFLGQRSDTSQLMAAADIHCQPNVSPEPFGVAFVEALHAGLPVVTTAMGGPLEIVDPACGLLVTPGDPAALAEGLRRLITDPAARARLGEAGPERARKLCDPRESLSRLHTLLTSICNGHGVPA